MFLLYFDSAYDPVTYDLLETRLSVGSQEQMRKKKPTKIPLLCLAICL